MNGFIIIIDKKEKNLDVPKIEWKSTFAFQSAHIKRNLNLKHFYLEQFTSEKFLSEKLWIDNKDFVCVTEGVIINKKHLLEKYHLTTDSQLISKLYQETGSFFEHFEGNFAGCFYDKTKDRFFVFNNQTGTKRLFYFSNDDYFVASTDLFVISQWMKAANICKSLDINAVYSILDLGLMVDNITYIDEVKQITAGNYIQFDRKKHTIISKSYFHLKNIEKNNDDKESIINNLDNLFQKSVQLEFDLDKNHGFRYLSTISGGLDSRMTSLIAHKLGYKEQHLINFSEIGYADEIIAKEIAELYHIDYQNIQLSPNCLTNIDDVIKVNDGLNNYTGSSHLFSVLQYIEYENLGCFHTGMIGDGVLGSFLSKPYDIPPKINTEKLSERTTNLIQKVISSYSSEELYKYYINGFLGANNGFSFYDLIGEGLSPFLNTKFLSYAYSIPSDLKYKQRIYVDWIKMKHPDLAKFTWETIGGKPTNSTLIRGFYRVKRAVVKRLPIKTMWKNNMNPEQIWYDNNPQIKKILDNYFTTHLELLDSYGSLKEDLIKCYNQGNIVQKAHCLTILGSIKLLFE